ncbi:MAG: hypothetical protein KC917_10290 [Candidatus Omnitrophica bacterium]|nr:hypothetical protein [Candidatus Omnitrophota bacterium]
MTRVGQHNPESIANSSSLWAYAESPVTSAKMNAWAGNIEAGFWLLHRVVRLMADNEGGPYLIDELGNTPLRVHEQSSPDLTVRVDPGFALGSDFLIGLSEEATLPSTGAFTPPTTNPRIDAIGIGEDGEWEIVTGTEDPSPTAPSLSATTVPLCEIFFRVGSTSIKDTDDSTNAYITDTRPKILSTLAHRHSDLEQPAESPDGARTQFSTSTTYVSGSLRVYANGLIQIPGIHYTEDTNLDGYTLTTAPPMGFVLAHEFLVR